MKLTENQIRRIVRRVIAEQINLDYEIQPHELEDEFEVELWTPGTSNTGYYELEAGIGFKTLKDAQSFFDNEAEADWGDLPSGVLKLKSKDGNVVSEKSFKQSNKSRHGSKSRRFDDDWKREQAMQSGMAFGTKGYNDEMGW